MGRFFIKEAASSCVDLMGGLRSCLWLRVNTNDAPQSGMFVHWPYISLTDADSVFDDVITALLKQCGQSKRILSLYVFISLAKTASYTK